jgi:hypothetical protein
MLRLHLPLSCGDPTRKSSTYDERDAPATRGRSLGARQTAAQAPMVTGTTCRKVTRMMFLTPNAFR